MPLEILAPVVLVGIVVVVLMVWLLANHPPRLLENAEIVSGLFLSDYPEAVVSGSWIISDDKKLAVCGLSAPKGAVGLAEVLGSKHVTRLLSAADIREVREEQDGIVFHLDDFTLPSVRIAAQEQEKRLQIMQISQQWLHSDNNLNSVTQKKGS